MARESAANLTTFVRNRAGESLRTVVPYDGRTYTVHYLRDDLTEPDVLARLEEVLANVISGGGRRDEKIRSEFGTLSASVQIREDGVIMHFPKSTDSGVLLSFESAVAKQLDDFVGECLRRL